MWMYIVGVGIGLIIISVIFNMFLKKSDEERRKNAVVIGSESKKVKPNLFLTLDELKEYDGNSVEKKNRLLIGIRDKLYDVSSASDFYGVGGPYHCFTGCDATYMLATMSTNKDDANKSVEKLNLIEEDTLNQWEMKFETKYPIVGYLCVDDADKKKRREQVDRLASKSDKTE